MSVNVEQLEAEMHAGLGAPIDMVVSQTTLAHLVVSAQRCLPWSTNADTVNILKCFIRDATRVGGFTGATAQLIHLNNVALGPMNPELV